MVYEIFFHLLIMLALSCNCSAMLPSEPPNSTVEDNIATAKVLTGELNNLATLMTKKGYNSQNISRNFPFSFSDVIDTTSTIVDLFDRFLPELLPTEESESFKKAVSDVFKTIDSVAKPTLQMQPFNITLYVNHINGSVKAYITYKSENTFNHMKKSCHENNTYDILTLLNSNLHTFSKLKNSLYSDESIDKLYRMAYVIVMQTAAFTPFCHKAETNSNINQDDIDVLMLYFKTIENTFFSLQNHCYEHFWNDDVANKIMTNCANQFDSGAYYLRTSQCIVETYDKNYKRANYGYMAITYDPVGGYNNHGVCGYGYHHLFRFDNRNIILLRSKSHYTTCKVLSSVDDLYKQSEGGREYGQMAKYAFEKCGDLTAVAFIRAKGVDQTSWTTKPDWFINKQYIGNGNVNSFVYAGFK